MRYFTYILVLAATISIAVGYEPVFGDYLERDRDYFDSEVSDFFESVIDGEQLGDESYLYANDDVEENILTSDSDRLDEAPGLKDEGYFMFEDLPNVEDEMEVTLYDDDNDGFQNDFDTDETEKENSEDDTKISTDQLSMSDSINITLKMPDVTISSDDTYLCTTVKIDNYNPTKTLYITGYTPHAIQSVAHHMLLFGCTEPGSKEAKAWNCGGTMHGKNSEGFVAAPVCAKGSSILWAWAKDAPSFQLPEGVGFQVGHGTRIHYLTLQAHFKSKVAANQYGIDRIGVTASATTVEKPKVAAIYLLATSSGSVPPNSRQEMDIICKYKGNIVMHPFAFRTHTHALGKEVYGYMVKNDKWSLIGKKDPQLPQAFYPVKNKSMEIKKGDWLAARCVMVSHRSRTTYIGDKHTDEMCNFYFMYWTPRSKAPNGLRQTVCSNGYPSVHWNSNFTNVPHTLK